MNAEIALMGALGAPIAQALLVMLAPKPPGLRDLVHMGLAAVSAVCAILLVGAAASGLDARIVIARPLPNIDLAFSVEPIGALAAALIASVGFLHAVHTGGMVRASNMQNPTHLMALTALANAGAIGVALSSNLLSMFVAYELLIMAAFPMVMFGRGEDARAAGRRFLAPLLTASVGLLLPAIVWTNAIAGPGDFQAGGVLAGRIDAPTANILLALFAIGLAGAATPPLHVWINAAADAPHSAVSSLFAISLAPAGCVGVLKVAVFVFGPALADARAAAFALIALLGVGMCAAALGALAAQDVRRRLAYSCVVQAQAVVIGALLASPAGVFAAVLQLVALTCAAATLTMAAGTVAAVTERRSVDEVAGLGRLMPWTFASFALAAASMIGLPPFAGAWAKLWLITAAAGAGMVWAAVLVGAAAILTFMHLGPLAARALVEKSSANAFRAPDGASFLLVAPVFLGAVATLWLLVLADPIASFLSPLWRSPQ